VVYKHMWYDGALHQGQCEGCTTTPWHMKDAVYLNARGVSFAVLTSGPWDEVASYVEFMGYTQQRVSGSLGLLDMTRRGVGGQPRGLARDRRCPPGAPVRGPPGVLVLALGRRRRRHLGPGQPPRAVVDPPRRDPRGVPRPAWPPPLTGPRRGTGAWSPARSSTPLPGRSTGFKHCSLAGAATP
jgi:hypothetical protein